MKDFNLNVFLLQSNRIEGYNDVKPGEVVMAKEFLSRPEIKLLKAGRSC